MMPKSLADASPGGIKTVRQRKISLIRKSDGPPLVGSCGAALW